MEKNRPIHVKEVMNRKIVAVHPDTPVRDVAALMAEHHMRTLPVVDFENKVVSVIGQSAYLMFKHDVPTAPIVDNGKLVKTISRVDFIRLIAGEG